MKLLVPFIEFESLSCTGTAVVVTNGFHSRMQAREEAVIQDNKKACARADYTDHLCRA